MGFLKKALGVAAAPFTGGASLGLLGKDTLFGKKDMGTADRIIDLDPSLKKAVEGARANQYGATQFIHREMERLKGKDPSKLASLLTAQKQKGLQQEAQDQEMRAKQLVAQRGLGRSSVGLGTIMRAGEDARKKAQEIGALSPLQEESLMRQRAADMGRLSGMANQILGAQGAQRQVMLGRQGTGKRSGGLLKGALQIGGGILGGMKGGAGGASSGAQMGGALGNILGNIGG